MSEDTYDEGGEADAASFQFPPPPPESSSEAEFALPGPFLAEAMEEGDEATPPQPPHDASDSGSSTILYWRASGSSSESLPVCFFYIICSYRLLQKKLYSHYIEIV